MCGPTTTALPATAASSTLCPPVGTRLPPTNTTVEPSETPLDTVYFAANPNTQPQALQVAADLGLAESSVLAFTDPETAHVDMGLAQVLVMLGSSPGMLATGDGSATPTTVAG